MDLQIAQLQMKFELAERDLSSVASRGFCGSKSSITIVERVVSTVRSLSWSNHRREHAICYAALFNLSCFLLKTNLSLSSSNLFDSCSLFPFFPFSCSPLLKCLHGDAGGRHAGNELLRPVNVVTR